ncbi:12988_t:CDS:2 [Ambispora gerdemannii]|uniref:O-acyltransferase n=1 Tax=Ambispora gerdemannii TaxID=144530 RepID=A0A9N9GFK2_9GLOM|nr:12988_t:CDS:2 [Ambispora gerdemannii]
MSSSFTSKIIISKYFKVNDEYAPQTMSQKTTATTITATINENDATNDDIVNKEKLTITATITATNIEQKDELYALSKILIKRYVTFKPRGSQLDRETMDKQQDPFRGFFTLFWIAMAFYIIQTVMHNLEKGGTFVDLSFARLFSRDAFGLMLSDACMIAATFFDVVFQKIVSRGWIRWRYTEVGLGGDLSSLMIQLKSLRNEYNLLLGLNKKSDDDNVNNDVTHRLSNLHQKIEEIESCMKSPSGKVSYPDNLTFSNFFDYLLIPTLVYEFEYPRTVKIRPWYVFEKALATLGTFLLLYVNTETYIIPVIPSAAESFTKAFLGMSFPFMVNYLLIFYIIFECICNLFAEISCFADRNFYDDWWNSATFDEYARKWNKPVHHFLLRHVYQTSIDSYKLSKRDASFMTFFLSSLVHELVMIVVSKKIRMYLFALQMFQLPLIWMGNLPAMRRRRWLGNAFFWFGMFAGPPLLGILYCCEIALTPWIFLV